MSATDTGRPAARYHFAVVPSRGCYASGSRVTAASVHVTLDAATRAAARATARYRRGMPGHTSGGYRVVAIDVDSRREASWQFGHDLDAVPSVLS